MPSAYELMLVLRGRNYLSNDLRRAGADLRRMQTQSSLTNQRSQLQVNQQRLQSTRAIAQAEMASITTGTRRIALNKAIAAQDIARSNALQTIRRTEEAVARTESQRLRNQAQLSRLDRRVSAGRPLRGFTLQETRQLRDAAAQMDAVLAEQANTQRRQLEIAQQNYANVAYAAQGLSEKEAELAQRQAVLTDRINTTNASLDLNRVKLDENALAMRRLPFERFAAGARYVEHLGRTFQTLGLFATAAIGYAAHAASQFQSQVTLAATQTRLPGQGTGAVIRNAGVLQTGLTNFLARGQTAASPGDLTQGLYSVFSGITLKGNQKQQLQEGLNIVKQFSKVFTANYGQVQFNDVVKAGIALINNFGLSANSLPRVLNRMQASVRFGAMTMGEFVGSLNQVVPAFRSAHYGFDQMSADIAFVSRLFPSLRFGTTGLARLVETFGKNAAAISQDVGKNIAPGGKLLPVDQIAQLILRRHPDFAKGGINAQNYLKDVTGSTGTIQARRVLTAFLSQLGLYRQIARQVIGDNKELDTSFRNMSQTPAVRWKEFTNQLRALVMQIGAGAIPVFQKLAQPIQHLVGWFEKLSPQTRHAIGTFAAWAAVGTTLVGTFGILAGAVGRGYAAIRLLTIGRGGLMAAEGGFANVGVAMRLGFVGAILIAIPLLVRYHHQIGHIVNKLGGLHSMLGLLAIAFSAFTFVRLIGGLTRVTGQANTARNSVKLLGAQLGLLPATVLTTIVVEVVVHRQQLDNFMHGIQQKLVKLQQGGFTTWLAKTEAGTANLIPGVHVNYKNLLKPIDPSIMQDNPSLGNTPAPNAQNTPIYQQFLRNAKKALDATHQARGIGRRRNYVPHTVVNANGQTVPAGFTSADVMTAVHNIVRLDAIAAAHPGSYADTKAAMDALNRLQKSASKDQFAIAQQLISQLESVDKKHTRNAVSEAKKRANKLKQIEQQNQKEVTQAAQSLQQTYQSAYQNNVSAFGSLFSGPYINSAKVQDQLAFGGHPTGQMLKQDLKAQISQFRQWRRVINKLVGMGMPNEMLQQILLAGPSALPELRALVSLGPVQLHSYFRLFNQAFGQKGIIEQATGVDVKRQLTHYRSFGRQIALAIIQGLRDEHTPMLKYFTDLVLKMFPGLSKRAHGHGANPTHGSIHDHPPIPRTGSGHHTVGHTRVNHNFHHGRGYGYAGPNTVVYQMNTKPLDPSTALQKAKRFHKATYGDNWIIV